MRTSPVSTKLGPLKERDRATLPIEAVADLAGEGLWVLRALYGDSSPGASPTKQVTHRTNPQGLLGCLEPATE